MSSCVVYGCSNNNATTADPSVHYYVFPKLPVFAQQWIQACGWHSEPIDTNTAKICSIHFDESNYTTEVKMIDYLACYTKVLKYDAVPTLFLPSSSNQILLKEVPTSSLVANQNTSIQETEVTEMLVFTIPSGREEVDDKKYIELQMHQFIDETNSIKDNSIMAQQKSSDGENNKPITTKFQLDVLDKQNESIRQNVNKLEESTKRLKATLAKKMEVFKNRNLELTRLHHEYLKNKRSYISLNNQKVLLSKVFSESQIKILSGKKRSYWTDDDMAVGYTVRHLSNKKFYVYLTKKLNFPLPAVSSIKRWLNTNENKKENGGDEEGKEDSE